MGWLREAMIGGHQGRAIHHERRAKVHRAAEQRWRDKKQPDPYECRGGLDHKTPALALDWMVKYREWCRDNGREFIETPYLYRCYDGHVHVHGPTRSMRLGGDSVGTPYPSG